MGNRCHLVLPALSVGRGRAARRGPRRIPRPGCSSRWCPAAESAAPARRPARSWYARNRGSGQETPARTRAKRASRVGHSRSLIEGIGTPRTACRLPPPGARREPEGITRADPRRAAAADGTGHPPCRRCAGKIRSGCGRAATALTGSPRSPSDSRCGVRWDTTGILRTRPDARESFPFSPSTGHPAHRSACFGHPGRLRCTNRGPYPPAGAYAVGRNFISPRGECGLRGDTRNDGRSGDMGIR